MKTIKIFRRIPSASGYRILTTDYRLLTTGRKAFTLMEMLIVVIILLLLVGILVPALVLIRQEMRAKLTQSNIVLIATACDLYANDYENNYASGNPTSFYPPSEDTAGSGFYFNGNPMGAEILALLLTGYAPDPGNPGEPYEATGGRMSDDDGRAGFGFRTVRRGKIYGPYNGTEKIPTVEGRNHTVFADAFGNPILYYQRDSLSVDFEPTHNNPIGPTENYKDHKDNDYWDTFNDSDRLYLILSPGPDGGWKDKEGADEPGKDEDDVMN